MKFKNIKKNTFIKLAMGLGILIPHYLYYAVTGYYCVWANIGYLPLASILSNNVHFSLGTKVKVKFLSARSPEVHVP